MEIKKEITRDLLNEMTIYMVTTTYGKVLGLYLSPEQAKEAAEEAVEDAQVFEIYPEGGLNENEAYVEMVEIREK